MHVFLIVLMTGCQKAVVERQAEEIYDANPARKYANMYTRDLDKDFQWKRFSYIGPWYSFDTTAYDDTVVAIVVINDTAISFMGQIFQYVDSAYRAFGYMQYTTDPSRALVYANKSVQSTHNAESITYYYKIDSVRYSDIAGGRGGSSAYILHTP